MGTFDGQFPDMNVPILVMIEKNEVSITNSSTDFGYCPYQTLCNNVAFTILDREIPTMSCENFAARNDNAGTAYQIHDLTVLVMLLKSHIGVRLWNQRYYDDPKLRRSEIIS